MLGVRGVPMSSNARWRSALSQAQIGRGLAVAVCVSVSACSADVTRFDFRAFNLSESSNTQTGSLPRAGSGSGYAGSGPGYYDGPRGAGLGDDTGDRKSVV